MEPDDPPPSFRIVTDIEPLDQNEDMNPDEWLAKDDKQKGYFSGSVG
jgi:hypothetical protein